MFITPFNFNVPLIKRGTRDNALIRGNDWYHINRSVSLSPLYLIHLLILHPRTSSKKRLCGLCAETDTRTEQGANAQNN